MVKNEPSWDKFPTNKEARKKLLEAAAKYAADEVAPTEPSWGTVNSPLRESDNYPHGFSFESTFASVIPSPDKNLQTYIETTLGEKRGRAIAIEFGGPGSEAFAAFSNGFFKKTAGVCLNDSRDLMRPNPRPRDKERHHDLIVGNIFDDDTYKKLEVWLQGEKVDLIFERLLGGTMYVPREPHMLGATLQRWYELLNEGGILFVEVPKDLGPFISAWGLKLSAEKIEGLVLDNGRNKAGDRFESFPIRIRKLKGAPAKLPLLDAKIVTAISRDLRKS